MDVGCILDYGLRLWAPTFVSRAISAVAASCLFCQGFLILKQLKYVLFQGYFL